MRPGDAGDLIGLAVAAWVLVVGVPGLEAGFVDAVAIFVAGLSAWRLYRRRRRT